MKTCSKCKITKPLTDYRLDKSSKNGLRSQCRQCDSESYAEWLKNNPEKHAARVARWYKNNPGKNAEISARWRKAHPEKAAKKAATYRKNNPEKAVRWAKNNPSKINAYAAKRRASELQATPSWADHKKIDAVYRLADMLSALKGAPYHVDHIYPLQGKTVCGLHVHQNLQVLPSDVNIAKRNKVRPDVVGATVSGSFAWVGE